MGQPIASRNTSWGSVVVISTAPPAGPVPDFSGEPISIELNPDLVERLGRDVLDTFKTIAKRGSEVGGMLLGQIGTGSRTVVVEDYELVECAYTRGPLYLLSDEEKQRLIVFLRHRNGRNESLIPVGFFRSNTRKELALDGDDVSLMRTHFADPRNVLLLVKPFSMKPCTASFYAWEDGELQQTPGWAQFPFKRSDLPGKLVAGPVAAPGRLGPKVAEQRTPLPAEPESRPPDVAAAPPQSSPAPVRPVAKVTQGVLPSVPAEPEQPPTTVVATAPASSAAAVAPAEPPPAPCPPSPQTAVAAADAPAWNDIAVRMDTSPVAVHSANAAAPASEPHRRFRLIHRIRWVLPAVAAFLLFIAGAFFQHRMESQSPSPNRKPDGSLFSLKVERSAGQLHLSWDRHAATIRAAQTAALFIVDGGQEQVLKLSVNEFRTGDFVYSPTSSDVVFRLELTNAEGRTVGEAIRSMVSRPSPLGAPALVAAPPAPAAIPEVPKIAPPAPAEQNAAPPPPQPAPSEEPPTTEPPQASTSGPGAQAEQSSAPGPDSR